MQCERGHPKGCMVALGVMSAPSPESTVVTHVLTKSRARTRAGIKACVERGVLSDELLANTDVASLTAVFDSFLTGISTLVRDGVGLRVINTAITTIMSVWDAQQRPT
jgi:hypothetical protein